MARIDEWETDIEPLSCVVARVWKALGTESLWQEGSYAKIISSGLYTNIRRPPCVPIMVADLRVMLRILDRLNEIGPNRMRKLLTDAMRGSRGWVDDDLYARIKDIIRAMDYRDIAVEE